MLCFNMQPSIGDKFKLFQKLRVGRDTFYLLTEKIEDNFIAAIYDNNTLCGGALVFGKNPPVYMFCFFEKEEYYTEHYYCQLKTLIKRVLPAIELYDVFNIFDENGNHVGGRDNYESNSN